MFKYWIYWQTKINNCFYKWKIYHKIKERRFSKYFNKCIRFRMIRWKNYFNNGPKDKVMIGIIYVVIRVSILN